MVKTVKPVKAKKSNKSNKVVINLRPVPKSVKSDIAKPVRTVFGAVPQLGKERVRPPTKRQVEAACKFYDENQRTLSYVNGNLLTMNSYVVTNSYEKRMQVRLRSFKRREIKRVDFEVYTDGQSFDSMRDNEYSVMGTLFVTDCDNNIHYAEDSLGYYYQVMTWLNDKEI